MPGQCAQWGLYGSVQAVADHFGRHRDADRYLSLPGLGPVLGARAYYQALRERGIGHQAALRQLGNRLVGILHGCLKTGTS